MVHDLRWSLQTNEVSGAIRRIIGSLAQSGNMSPITAEWARVLKTGTQLRFRTMRAPDDSPWKKARRGGQTLSLSRRLRNSITGAYDRTSAAVGTNVLYAAIHQFGGVIRAKSGPFLAIPVTPAAMQAGSPRNMQGLHVWQTTKGQYVLGDDKGTVHFLLRAKVTMPARPFLGASEADQAELVRVVQAHMNNGWRR